MKMIGKGMNFILILIVIYLTFALVQANGNIPKVSHKISQLEDNTEKALDSDNNNLIDKSDLSVKAEGLTQVAVKLDCVPKNTPMLTTNKITEIACDEGYTVTGCGTDGPSTSFSWVDAYPYGNGCRSVFEDIGYANAGAKLYATCCKISLIS